MDDDVDGGENIPSKSEFFWLILCLTIWIWSYSAISVVYTQFGVEIIKMQIFISL